MDQRDELVALYDAFGDVTGSTTRSRMRREGLWHAAASVLVLSPGRDRVYVHRRTDTKDVFPGMHDCWAGGVVAADEPPDETATRELGEELGVHGVSPRFVLRTRYERDEVRFHAFLYEVSWSGPMTLQADEVAEGSWMRVDELRARLSDTGWPFVPDGRQFFYDWLSLQ